MNCLRTLTLLLVLLAGPTLAAASGSEMPAGLALAAQEYLDIDVLEPTGSAPGRGFGRALAVEGDLAVVGAPNELSNGQFVGGAAYVFTQTDGRWRLRTRLLPPPDSGLGPQFGSSVALANGQLLIGAPSYRVGGNSWDPTGAVFVYAGSGSSWSESQRLLASSNTHSLGRSLAVSGNTLLAGLPDQGQAGAAVVFTAAAGSWSQQALLSPTGAISGDQFGRSVALDGDTALVGDPYEGSGDTGAAYLFQRNGAVWNATQRLAPSADASANAGWSLALVGTRALLGAPRHDSNGIDRSGAVFIYAHSAGSWTLRQTLTGSGQAVGQFGDSLVFNGTEAIIGEGNSPRAWGRRGQLFVAPFDGSDFATPQQLPASPAQSVIGGTLAVSGAVLFAGNPFENLGGVSSDGRAAIYRKVGGAWTPAGFIDAPLTDGTQRFGIAVALSGDVAAVGAPWRSVDGMAERGEVFVFAFDGSRWQPVATVRDASGLSGDRFGSSVALDNDRLLVGAPWRDNGVSDGGSALLFEYDGSNWIERYRYDNGFASGDRLGTSVALVGSRALAGAPYSEQVGPTNAGMVLVAQRSGGNWALATLLGGLVAQERLGTAVALTPSSVVAGAPNADAGAGRVRAFRFILGSWTQLTSLSAPAGAAGFGATLAGSGPLLAVGAPNGNSGSGRVAVYRETVTGFVNESLPAISPAPQRLGTAVALSADRLAAGSSNNGTTPAAFYLFERDGSGTWSFQGSRSSPDGSPVTADGFGDALALGASHLLAGAQWRPLDEGRVFAYMAPATISLAVNALTPQQPVTGQAFSVSVSATSNAGIPGGDVTVSLATGESCVATLAAGNGQCSLSSSSAGNRQLSLSYTPSAPPFLPTTLLESVTVLPASTVTSLSASPGVVHPGQTLTLSAAVAVLAPGAGTAVGSISFHRDNLANPALCTVAADAANCPITAPAAGTVQYLARYQGSSDHLASSSAPLTVTISPWSTSSAILSVTPAGATVGQSLGVLVQVTPESGGGIATGRIRVSGGDGISAWVTLDGASQGVANLVPQVAGSIDLVAEFDGQSGDYANSTSPPLAHTVVPLQSMVQLSATPDSGLVAGDEISVAMAASLQDGSSATGDLSLHLASSNNPPLCTQPAPTAGCIVILPQSGATTLVARYSGDTRAAPSETSLELIVARRPTSTTVASLPATLTVGQTVTLSAQVTSDWGDIAGTVLLSLGPENCSASTSVTGFASCTVQPQVRGDVLLSAEFSPSNLIHAASTDSSTRQIMGLISGLSIGLSPAGPWRVDQTILVSMSMGADGDEFPAGGLITLRRDAIDGPVLCVEGPPVATCGVALSDAGPLTLHARYDGDARFEPSSGQTNLFVEPRVSAIVWDGTDPATVVLGEPFSIRLRVNAEADPAPAGEVDFLDGTEVLCAAVTRDGEGRFVCPRPAPITTNTQYVNAVFRSADPNASDATLLQRAIVVAEAITMVRVNLDNGVDTYHPGDLLNYALRVQNLGGDADANIVLEMALPDGLQGMNWQCVEADGGALCPIPANGSGALSSEGSLPPGGSYRFEVTATVSTPTPAEIEAQARANLLQQANDDPGQLLGVDLDFNASGELFHNGFEAGTPQQKLSANDDPAAALPLPRQLPDTLGIRPLRLLSLLQDDVETARLEAASVSGAPHFRHLVRDPRTGLWRVGPWRKP